MATRKSLVLVSGLFQELNSSSDKLDFAGNSTSDLNEGSNQYFTNARSRGSISVTDTGGDGSLAYNSSTGVITYTGPSASEARAHLSVASGSGLTYNSGTGEFGTSAIPNGQLANSAITIGATSVSLGATQGTFTGLTSLASTTLISGVADAANSIAISGGTITFEGSTADTNELILTAADATGSDKTLTLPNETGTLLSTASSIANSNLANSSVTIGSTSISLGGTATTFSGLSSLTSTTLVGTTIISGSADAANSITLGSGNIVFEGSGADAHETTLTVTNPSADRTITFPNSTGTVVLLNSLSVASGSGLTYNSGTGEFGTNAIPNSQLANSSVTVGSTGIALGGSATTIAGLSSITSTAVVTDDSGFRVRDNSDNTKQLAFECSGISGSTTRTMTIPDVNGTLVLLAASQTLTNKTLTSPVLTSAVLNTGLSGSAFLDEDDMASNSATKVASQQSIKAYVDTQLTAEDLDVQTDSGNFDVDLDSEPLILTGGTGIDTSGSGTTATFAIDSTVTTLTGSQTLTNKTLTSPVLNTGLSGSAFLDEDNMASNSATKVASQQSIKAYVDSQVTAQDLDITTDSGSIAIDLDSEQLQISGGTGINTSATGNQVSVAVDSTIATESFATAIAVALG